MAARQPIYPDYPIRGVSATPTPAIAGPRSGSAKRLRRCPLSGSCGNTWRSPTPAATNSDVAKLLEKGRALDITSSEEMKIHFGGGEGHFLISFSDLKNAFQAWAYDKRDNRLTRFDETMFLGAKYYSRARNSCLSPREERDPGQHTGQAKKPVHFNYRSLLYKKLASGLLAAAVAPDGNTICLLSEKNKRLYFSEAGFEIIQVSPYGRSKFDSRRDLNAIVDCSDRGRDLRHHLQR